jgi:hypothetical protein
MNFTAGGYARLNELLNPDIAVLEGGYSIQGALPYVNLSVALAMAGLDYSSVREPNFDPEKLKQDKKITDYIKDITDRIRDLYFDPPRDALKGDEHEGFFSSSKDVYYDTDQISESRLDQVRLCGNCPGVLKIETWSTANPLSCGIEIPRKACEKCLATGTRLFEEAHLKGNYRFIQLINRKDKEYTQYGF